MKTGKVKRPPSNKVISIGFESPNSHGIITMEMNFYEDNLKLIMNRLKGTTIVGTYIREMMDGEFDERRKQ